MTDSERLKEIKGRIQDWTLLWAEAKELLEIAESQAAEIEEGRKSEQVLLEIIESQGLEIGELKAKLAKTVHGRVGIRDKEFAK